MADPFPQLAKGDIRTPPQFTRPPVNLMRATYLVIVALVLSGCASKNPEPTPVPTAPAEITDPLDLLNSTNGAHVHNYWGGRTRITVLDQESGGGTYRSNGDLLDAHTFQPGDGDIVPQGTGRIEGVLSWTEGEAPFGIETEYNAVELWVKTAIDAEPRFAVRVKSGEPFSFNSTNEQDDPPHYVLSLWEFHAVVRNDGGDQTAFTGTFKLQVEAVRTLPMVVFPPHPDRWAGRTEIVLTDHDVEVQFHVAAGGFLFCGNGCARYQFSPDPNVVVPHDATSVEVVLTPSTTSAPVPLSLAFHGADTRAFSLVSPASAEPLGSRVFVIDLESTLGDSPYAEQSLWEFLVNLDTPTNDGAWTGSFHVSARALR
jgi:hypothetical protein